MNSADAWQKRKAKQQSERGWLQSLLSLSLKDYDYELHTSKRHTSLRGLTGRNDQVSKVRIYIHYMYDSLLFTTKILWNLGCNLASAVTDSADQEKRTQNLILLQPQKTEVNRAQLLYLELS